MISFNEYNTRKQIYESAYGNTDKGAETAKEFNEHLLESEQTEVLDETGPNGGFGVDPESDKAFKSFGIGLCGFLFFGPSVVLLAGILGGIGIVAGIKKLAQKRKRKKMYKEIDKAADNYKKAYAEVLQGRLAMNSLKRKIAADKDKNDVSNDEKDKDSSNLDKLKMKQDGLEKKPKSIDSAITAKITSTAKDGGNGDPDMLSYKNQKFAEAEGAALEEASKDVKDDESKKALENAKKEKEKKEKEEEEKKKQCEDFVPKGFVTEVSEEEYEKIKEHCGDSFEKLYKDNGTKKETDAEGNEVEAKDENDKPYHLLETLYDGNQDGINEYVKSEGLGKENEFAPCSEGQTDSFKSNKNLECHPWYDMLIIFKVSDDAKQETFDEQIKTIAGQINDVVDKIKKSAEADEPKVEPKDLGTYIMCVEMLKSFAMQNPDEEKGKENFEKMKTVSLFNEKGEAADIKDENITAVLVACAIAFVNGDEKDEYISSLKATCEETINGAKQSSPDAESILKKMASNVENVIDACKGVKADDPAETIKSLKIEITDDGIVSGSIDAHAMSKELKQVDEAIKGFKKDMGDALKAGNITNSAFNVMVLKVLTACKFIIKRGQDNPDDKVYKKIIEWYNGLFNGEPDPKFEDFIKNNHLLDESEYYSYQEYLSLYEAEKKDGEGGAKSSRKKVAQFPKEDGKKTIVDGDVVGKAESSLSKGAISSVLKAEKDAASKNKKDAKSILKDFDDIDNIKKPKESSSKEETSKPTKKEIKKITKTAEKAREELKDKVNKENKDIKDAGGKRMPKPKSENKLPDTETKPATILKDNSIESKIIRAQSKLNEKDKYTLSGENANNVYFILNYIKGIAMSAIENVPSEKDEDARNKGFEYCKAKLESFNDIVKTLSGILIKDYDDKSGKISNYAIPLKGIINFVKNGIEKEDFDEIFDDKFKDFNEQITLALNCNYNAFTEKQASAIKDSIKNVRSAYQDVLNKKWKEEGEDNKKEDNKKEEGSKKGKSKSKKSE